MKNGVDNLYTSSGFNEWEIGDISVVYHDGYFHLFHLIIPNHDYVAHAISKDFINWERTKNAIFVGHPGNWDDDMIWTMQVYKDEDLFHMYYTGLQLKDRGTISKIGNAVSKDLLHWTKVEDDVFPFGTRAPYYETPENNPRGWLSFRDPFRIDVEHRKYFLVCARAAEGPVYRRGCVGLIEWNNNQLAFLEPLHKPNIYDDVECPCAFELNGVFYLLGSIREDIKVRYWFAKEFNSEYHAFHSNVLLPVGNYAARVLQLEGKTLVYSFFYTYKQINSLRVFLPPKELDTDEKGRLILRSYGKWQSLIRKTTHQNNFNTVTSLLGNPTASFELTDTEWLLHSRSGYELFVFQSPAENYIWEGEITVEGMGKLGLFSDGDKDGSGYFYSFDVVNGIAEVRAWGFNEKDSRSNFVYIPLQDSVFKVKENNRYHFKLIRYSNYIELSVDHIVKLTLIDNKYSGSLIGLYSSSSALSVRGMKLHSLRTPYDTELEDELNV